MRLVVEVAGAVVLFVVGAYLAVASVLRAIETYDS